VEMPEAASLRGAIVAGEACPPELVERHFALRPQTGLWNEYGPTEGSVWSTVYAFPPGGLAGKVPIGRPIPNVQVHVLDRAGLPVPLGAAGELYVGGEGVTRGYQGRPELTAEKLVPDPFTARAGARLYRTGDLVRYLPDSQLLFLGRIDQQVKVRGFRIELAEIEAVLRSHRAVREAAVVAVEARRDETAGSSPRYQKLAAYLVLHPGEPEPQATALRSFLKERLPEYMVPSGFAILASLPLSANGKVDRRALALAETARLAPESPFVAPRNLVEQRLVEIWAELLDVERVGVHDSFFDLGGHSLLTTQLISRVRDAFGLEVPLQTFFEDPTVAGIAESIELSRWAVEAPGSVLAMSGVELEEGEL